jgi:hypothetical protein
VPLLYGGVAAAMEIDGAAMQVGEWKGRHKSIFFRSTSISSDSSKGTCLRLGYGRNDAGGAGRLDESGRGDLRITWILHKCGRRAMAVEEVLEVFNSTE